jgi:hypothetical protein
MSLKRDNPEAEQASVLLEPEIEYDYLIRVMDVVRMAEVPVAGAPEEGAQPAAASEAGDPAAADPKAKPPQTMKVALFTEIAVGDAP